MSPYAKLLRSVEVRALLVANLISSFGMGLLIAAVPLVVVQAGGGGFLAGLGWALQDAPGVLLSATSGKLADGRDRRRVLLWCDLGRAALLGVIVLAALHEAWFVATLLVLMVPVGALTNIHAVSRSTTLAAAVPPELYGAANALRIGVSLVGQMVGPIAAGFMLDASGPPGVFALEGLTFIASAICVFWIRESTRVAVPSRSLRGGFSEAWRTVSARPQLRATLVVSSIVSLTTEPLIPIATFFVVRELGHAPDVVGLTIAAFAGGGVLGVVATGWVPRSAMMLTCLVANAGSGLGLIALSGVSRVPMLLLLSGAAGALGAVSQSTSSSLRTLLTPTDHVGRVSSLAILILSIAAPLASLGAGAALEVVSGAQALRFVGIGVVAASILFVGWTAARTAGRSPE
jgi:predicted MFS family arabinose efflux permease